MGKAALKSDKPKGAMGFQWRVNHKVALFLGINLLGVLLVGAMSIFFARSISMTAEEIRREHQEIEIADRIHSTFQQFLFVLQRAVIFSRPVLDGIRSAYREELDQLLEREHAYHRESPEQGMVDQIRRTSSDLFKLSKNLGIDGPDVSAGLKGQLLDELENIGSRVQLLVHKLSVSHKARMDKLLEQNNSSMQWIFGFYGVFFLLGTLLVGGSSFYFGHTMARPLRWLARAAEKVSRGGVPEKVPVVSRDEIGFLSDTFNVMVERLAENETKLRWLTVLEERERIARELHDGLAQSIAFLNLKLNELESGLGKERPEAADGIMNEMREIVRDAYDDVRQAIFELRTEISENAGFIPNLTEFVHGYSAMRKISVDLKISDPDAIRFAPEVEVQLVRIIQEALTNVSKHAQAKKSTVSLECDGDYATVIVADDGKGFAVEGVNNSGFHFGLKTMRERTEAVGGQFTVESVLGKGTNIVVRLPLERSIRYEPDSSSSR